VHENTFIAPKVEEILEPVLKKEESQVDLFAGYFQSTPKVEEQKAQDADYVRHTLNDEIPADIIKIEPSFEFEIKTDDLVFKAETTRDEELPVVESLKEEEQVPNPDENKTDESIEEQLRKSKERILRLKDLSMKLRTSNGLQELENEPAYKRKQMSLQDVPHSSESQVSRFTLSTEDGITEIRPNNSFLHDNVD
jgi:cell division protein FtsZ